MHHALTQVLEPVFERCFSKDSFACRKGLGTRKALARAREGAGQYLYVLKCDIRKYFASIDHEILKERLARAIKCRPSLDLAARIIDGSNPQEETIAYYPGDDLFTPYERRRGLPLGNQTSQFFANVYLDSLDRLVNREINAGMYVRYVDDFLVFDDSKARLGEIKAAVEAALWRARIDLHQGKSRVYRVADGVTFPGWRVFPNRARLVRANVVAFRRRMRRQVTRYREGRVELLEIREGVRAWIAHAAQGNTWKLREGLLGEISFGGRRAAGGARGVVGEGLGGRIVGTKNSY